MKKIYSIIIPVFYNQESVSKTFHAIYDKVIQVNNEYTPEVIFIDDGSGDNSLEEILSLQKQHSFIKVIKFTRNFGQVSAILAGFEHSSGDCLINISADLQDPPELINDMINFHFNQNFDVVLCGRIDRDESLFRKTTSKLFYKAIRKLIFPTMPKGGFDYFLISRKVKDEIIKNKEANAFLQGQILYTGFKHAVIPYVRNKREHGKSRWTFSKKIKYLIDGILAYSYFPLRVMTIMGITCALLAFIYAIVIILLRFLGDVPFTGWAPIMVLILFLSGIQMTMLGVIGEYLWRALDQIRNRPQYVIEKMY